MYAQFFDKRHRRKPATCNLVFQHNLRKDKSANVSYFVKQIGKEVVYDPTIPRTNQVECQIVVLIQHAILHQVEKI